MCCGAVRNTWVELSKQAAGRQVDIGLWESLHLPPLVSILPDLQPGREGGWVVISQLPDQLENRRLRT